MTARARVRWRALMVARDEVVAERLVEHALWLRAHRDELRRWAMLAGLPEGEVVASPFGARMVAMGLEAGATTVHHELRPLVRWHPHLRPREPRRGGVLDPLHGRWHRGALRTGKYEEFCQEDPFCTYHPEHSSKWAPHEMLHRAVGFHAPSTATRFARYLAARLNELLPVATWYGLEHALRLDREGPFDRAREADDLEAPIDRARWLRDDERTLRRRARAAVSLVRFTLTRTAAELEAIDRERADASIVSSREAGVESFPGVRLDSSSDALAYVEAHARRLEHPAVAAIHTRLSRAHHRSLDALRASVDSSLDRLLFATLAPRASAVEARISANAVHDLLARAALVAPDAPLHAGWLARARRLVSRGHLTHVSLARFAAELCAALTDVVGSQRARAVVTLGLGPPREPLDLRELHRGVRAVVPRTARWLGARDLRELAASLAAPPRSRGHLALRIERALETSRQPLSELARLERLLDRAPRADPREGLSLDAAAAPDAARVSLHASAVCARFAADVLALHRGEPASAREIHVLSFAHDGEHHLYEISADVAEFLRRPRVRLWAVRRAVGRRETEALARAGVLVVLAPP